MRLFFGVGLPGEIKKQVYVFCLKVKEKFPKMKWVEEENLHITLKFLGELDKNKLAALSQLSSEAASSVKAFPVTLGALGAFPNPKRARVLWLGLKEGAEPAAKLFAALEERLVKSGFEAEGKTYHPHITLARLKFPAALLPLEELSTPSGLSFSASSFELYESTLTPKGPIYKIIERFELG